MIDLQYLTFNPFQENTYILKNEDTKECIVFDGGNSNQNENEELIQNIAGYKPIGFINTHNHIDHILGIRFLKEKYPSVPFLCSELDVFNIQAADVYAPNYGFPPPNCPQPDGFIEPVKGYKIGSFEFDIFSVPGHTQGHLAFYFKEKDFVIAGDCLFRGSIGRTDLPTGNFEVLKESIQNVFYQMPDSTIVYPGHGPETTIGYEKKFNPFVKAQ
jgi:glyoxylase-like metal-dependent hydrolase (beta-lactamase superfamily II)